MIAHAEKSVVINRPVQSVFQFVLNGANNRLWKPSVLEAHPLGGPPYGVGSMFHQEVKGPDGPLRGDYEITDYEENALIGVKVLEGPAPWHGRYEFRSRGAATEVRYSLVYEPAEYDPALTGRILDGMQRVLQQEQAALSGLSAQERRVLLLRSGGKANADIARTMFVGEGTVRNYVFSGLTKLMAPRIQASMEAEAGTLDELKAFLEKIA